MYKRINEIKKSLNYKLKLVKKDTLKEIEEFYDKQIKKVREDIDDPEERKLKVTDLADERDEKVKNTTIVNINEQYKDDELDIKLLYVAMTRTLHRLFIYHKEKTLPLLHSINSEFYSINENEKD